MKTMPSDFQLSNTNNIPNISPPYTYTHRETEGDREGNREEGKGKEGGREGEHACKCARELFPSVKMILTEEDHSFPISNPLTILFLEDQGLKKE